jgi:hypothetical protein
MIPTDSFHDPRNASAITPATRYGRHSRSLTTRNSTIRQHSLGPHQSDNGRKGVNDAQAQKAIEHRDSYKAFLRRQTILRKLDSKQSDHHADIFKDVAQPSYDLQICTGWPDSLSRLSDPKVRLRDLTPEMRKLEPELVYMHALTARHASSKLDLLNLAINKTEVGRIPAVLSKFIKKTDALGDIKEKVKLPLQDLAITGRSGQDLEKRAVSDRSYPSTPYQMRYFPKSNRELETLQVKATIVPCRPGNIFLDRVLREKRDPRA